MMNALVFLPTTFFSIIFFYAFFLLQMDGAPSPSHEAALFRSSSRTTICEYCKQEIAVQEGKTPKAAMLQHLKMCEKFYPEELQNEMEKIMEDFKASADKLGAEFIKNVQEYFREMALESGKLCDEFCSLDLHKQAPNEAAIMGDEHKNNKIKRIIALEQQIEQLLKQITSLTQMMAKKEEPLNKAEEKIEGVEKSNIMEKKSEKTEEKSPKMDSRLAELHARMLPFCKNAVGRICSVKEGLTFILAQAKNVPVHAFVSQASSLVNKMYEETVELFKEVHSFNWERKETEKDKMAQFDEQFVLATGHRLNELRHRLTYVTMMLNDNFHLLKFSPNSGNKEAYTHFYN